LRFSPTTPPPRIASKSCLNTLHSRHCVAMCCWSKQGRGHFVPSGAGRRMDRQRPYGRRASVTRTRHHDSSAGPVSGADLSGLTERRRTPRSAAAGILRSRDKRPRRKPRSSGSVRIPHFEPLTGIPGQGTEGGSWAISNRQLFGAGMKSGHIGDAVCARGDQWRAPSRRGW
jgi:hypothetical protein